MREIIVTVRGGNATVETKGFEGAECLAETADLEQALGKVTATTHTPEMRKMPAASKASTKGGR